MRKSIILQRSGRSFFARWTTVTPAGSDHLGRSPWRRGVRSVAGPEHGTLRHALYLPNPVIRSHYGNGFLKQYVRDHVLLRTEPASNNLSDYGVKKAVENLPQLRKRISGVIDNYQCPAGHPGNIRRPRATAPAGTADRDVLRQTHPRTEVGSSPATGRNARVGALQPHRRAKHLHHAQIDTDTLIALEASPEITGTIQLGFAAVRSFQAQAKGLVDKVQKSRRYRFPEGYSICLVFLKLFERIYAPLTAGLLPTALHRKLKTGAAETVATRPSLSARRRRSK
jgi:hypothetical protein